MADIGTAEPGARAAGAFAALQRGPVLDVEFCGERSTLSGERPFGLGSATDLNLDVGPSLPERLLELRQVNRLWFLEQTTPGAAVSVSDRDGLWHAELDPGRAVPLVFDHHLVRINARGTYEVELYLSDPVFRRAANPVHAAHSAGAGVSGGPFTWADGAGLSAASTGSSGLGIVAAGAGSGTTMNATMNGAANGAINDLRNRAVRLTLEQRVLLVSLAAPVLQRGDMALSEIASSVQAAQQLGWSVTKFNRKLDTICARLSAAGFSGLHGGSNHPALNRRTRLVQLVVAAGLIGPADLSLLAQAGPAGRVA